MSKSLIRVTHSNLVEGIMKVWYFQYEAYLYIPIHHSLMFELIDFSKRIGSYETTWRVSETRWTKWKRSLRSSYSWHYGIPNYQSRIYGQRRTGNCLLKLLDWNHQSRSFHACFIICTITIYLLVPDLEGTLLAWCWFGKHSSRIIVRKLCTSKSNALRAQYSRNRALIDLAHYISRKNCSMTSIYCLCIVFDDILILINIGMG